MSAFVFVWCKLQRSNLVEVTADMHCEHSEEQTEDCSEPLWFREIERDEDEMEHQSIGERCSVTFSAVFTLFFPIRKVVILTFKFVLINGKVTDTRNCQRNF